MQIKSPGLGFPQAIKNILWKIWCNTKNYFRAQSLPLLGLVRVLRSSDHCSTRVHFVRKRPTIAPVKKKQEEGSRDELYQMKSC